MKMHEGHGMRSRRPAVTGSDLFYTGLFCLIVAGLVGILLWRQFS